MFKDNEELNIILKEWKDLLFLNNWLIKAELVPVCYNDNGETVAGRNQYIVEQMTSKIQISTEQRTEDLMLTYCEEKVLVHELLHIKYNWVVVQDTYEGRYTDELEHQLLEQMARTLIIVKYKLPVDYFDNVKVG